ncbi:MAG: ABC transporter ATP-binding protein, partial [Dehalococcoidia bacterium]|nr:ABC transporter ATP-binding protein [Dehalococcoidia bacterium]
MKFGPKSHGASMSLQDVTVELGGNTALSNVTFDVNAGTLMGVVGPNGAGKSTLFNAIAGLLPVRHGQVTLNHVDQRRGALAYVPQRESVNWRFPVTVQDVVMMGRCCRLGWFRRPGKRDRELVRACLGRVGLRDHHSSLMTELSGGQKQRVFVARALAQEASVLLLDEAFSGIDAGAQEDLIGVLK